MPPARQLELLPWVNPLGARIGAEFFRELPAAPGVYRWLSREAEVLYVGSSRNLRQRVASYRSISPASAPRRLCRLVHAAWAVHIEPTADEADARSLEAKWIRHYRPRFNRALNRPPETIWTAWEARAGVLTTAWSSGAEPPAAWAPGLRPAGPHPHRGPLHDLQAIRRTLWWVQAAAPDLRACPPPLRDDRRIAARWEQPCTLTPFTLAGLLALAAERAPALAAEPWNAPLVRLWEHDAERLRAAALD